MFNTFNDVVVPTLEAYGHEVDHRPVAIGETPGDYDLVVAGVVPLGSIQITNQLGGFGVLGWGKPTVLLFDDWRVRETVTVLTTMRNKGPETYFTRRRGDGYYYSGTREQLLAVAEPYHQLLEAYVHGWPENWYGLLPFHQFGNHLKAVKKLPERARLARFDPSPFVQRPDVEPAHAFRKPRWALATVQDYSAWIEKQGLTWPVDVYGASLASRKKGHGYPVLKNENLVATTYAGYAGVLSPPHQHAGSGWFRTRYVHAAEYKNVLGLDAKDRAMFAGRPSGYSYTPQQAEGMTPAQVATLAAHQSEEFYSTWYPSRREVEEGLIELVEAVVAGRPVPDRLRLNGTEEA